MTGAFSAVISELENVKIAMVAAVRCIDNNHPEIARDILQVRIDAIDRSQQRIREIGESC